MFSVVPFKPLGIATDPEKGLPRSAPESQPHSRQPVTKSSQECPQ